MTELLGADSHVIIVPEGGFERVAVDILMDANAFVFPADNVIEVSRVRKAVDIQDRYLTTEYDWPVSILRILDSRKERFVLGNLYRDRYPVINVYTRPEAEILAIIHEGRINDYYKVESAMKPNEFCKQYLGMPDIKKPSFLRSYWDAGALISAAGEYKHLHKLGKDELCLADILRVG